MTASTVEKTAPQVAINDIGSEEDLLAAIDATIKDFNDGDIVEGRHRQGRPGRGPARHRLQDRGCHPLARALHQARRRPLRGRQGRRRGRGPGPPEGGQGRPADPVQEARAVRARLGHDREDQGRGRRRHRHRHRGRQGWTHPRHRPARLPARLARRDASRPRPPALRGQGDRGQDHRARQEPQQRGPVAPCLARADPVRGAHHVPQGAPEGSGPLRRRRPRIVNFGAFVDLGGVDGLVHVSELSWKHIDHPSEVVEVGQEVTVEVLDVDMDRERVSLSLKATQEDPWQHFARTHAIGQVVPGKVTKLVPFGAFVRVDDGIEGLVHISELAERHVELPEQVVTVGDDIFVKVIDIDLERRRISLSLKQANDESAPVAEFDPTLYGMAAEYDEQGNYKYPEGFDPETNEWLEGFETQREKWEKQYAEAHARWEAHKAQVEEAAKADAEAAANAERLRRPTPPAALAAPRARPTRRQLVRDPPASGLRGHAGLRRGAGRPAREAHRQLSTRRPYDVKPRERRVPRRPGPRSGPSCVRAVRPRAGTSRRTARHGVGRRRVARRTGAGRWRAAHRRAWQAVRHGTHHRDEHPGRPRRAARLRPAPAPDGRSSPPAPTGARRLAGDRRRRRAGPHRHLDLPGAGQDRQRPPRPAGQRPRALRRLRRRLGAGRRRLRGDRPARRRRAARRVLPLHLR